MREPVTTISSTAGAWAVCAASAARTGELASAVAAIIAATLQAVASVCRLTRPARTQSYSDKVSIFPPKTFDAPPAPSPLGLEQRPHSAAAVFGICVARPPLRYAKAYG